MMLGADGATIGTFNVPLETRIRSAGRDAVWVTETDADGLEDIVKYRLQ
jgi:hypothetical protein